MAEPLPELTPAQVEQFRDAYTVFDKDGDGGITTEELGYVMRALGQNPSDEEVEEMFSDVDEASRGRGVAATPSRRRQPAPRHLPLRLGRTRGFARSHGASVRLLCDARRTAARKLCH